VADSGVNSLAITTFSVSCGIESQPTITVETGRVST